MIEGQNAVAPALCFAYKFHGQNTRDQIMSDISPNVCDQSAFCAFHTFLVEVQTYACYIHVTHV